MEDDQRDRKAEPTDASQEPGAVAERAKPERERDDVIHLEWRDWIALTMASLETILLPAVAVAVVLIILALAFAHL